MQCIYYFNNQLDNGVETGDIVTTDGSQPFTSLLYLIQDDMTSIITNYL